jgi:copper chaperone CopZ
MKKVIILFALAFIANGVSAQELKKVEEVTIQTSAKCFDCKGRIEDALNYLNGVKFAELDNETKVVTVRYKTKKVNFDQIKSEIAATGYDADEVKALDAAIEKLPACCKPSVEKH